MANDRSGNDIADVFLFPGTLDELNGIDSHRQYEIATQHPWRSTWNTTSVWHLDSVVNNARTVLRRDGYDGLIHCRSEAVPTQASDGMVQSVHRVYGTPVRRKVDLMDVTPVDDADEA